MPKTTHQVDDSVLNELEQYSQEQYIKSWKNVYNTKITNDSTEAAKTSARREAQRKAVDETFVACLIRFYPGLDEKTIWNAIGKVHKLNLANLGELGVADEVHQEVYDRCISAHQSWIKASGHSFE